ncbi:MAG: oligosaccharide flippase family protein [Sandaracinaceae bacterium]
MAADGRESLAGLGHRAARGALWVTLGVGGAYVLRFGASLIFTRLIYPEAFGLMALVGTILGGIELFSDLGIGPAIIQNEREDDRFVNTAWTLQILRGVGLMLLSLVLGPVMGWAYDEPQLVYLIPLVGVTALTMGFNSTRGFTLNRKLSLGRLEAMLLMSQIFGIVVTVAWAVVEPSVLALVAGNIAYHLLYVVLSHSYLPGIRNRLDWDPTAVRSLITFGRWIFVSTAVTFLAGQSDRLIFGKLVTFAALGVYSIGTQVALIPSEVLARLSQQIIFPVYVQIRERGGDFLAAFNRTRAPVLVIGGWAYAGFLAGGPTGIELLYDDRYLDAGWVVQLIALSAWFILVGNTYGAALLAHGKAMLASFASIAKLVGIVTLVPVGYVLAVGQWGDDGALFGAVSGFAAAELFRYFVAAGASAQLGIRGWGEDAKHTLLLLAVGGTAAALAWWMDRAGLHVVLRAVAITLAVSAVYGPIVYPQGKRVLEERRRRREQAAEEEARAQEEAREATTRPGADDPPPEGAPAAADDLAD